jgi:hypothetical protein
MVPPTVVTFTSTAAHAAGPATINKPGTTQLRVYFNLDGNNDGGTPGRNSW